MAERSFSKLKLIKSFFRSSMSQERLSGLALLSIENERAQNLDFRKFIVIVCDTEQCKHDMGRVYTNAKCTKKGNRLSFFSSFQTHQVHNYESQSWKIYNSLPAQKQHRQFSIKLRLIDWHGCRNRQICFFDW